MKVLFTFLKFKIHRTIVNQNVSPFFTWNKDFFGNYTRSKIAFVRVYTRHKRKQNSFPPLVRLRKYCQKRIWNWRFIPLASKLKTRFLGKTILNVYLYRVTMIEYVMCHSFEKKRQTRKWESRNTPPFTSPLVLIALRLSVVMTQTAADIPIMMTLCNIPACATTQDNRKKSITPHMFKRHGIRTPWIHPSFIPVCFCCDVATWPASTLGSWNYSVDIVN